jgi:hypothetical protein
MNVPKKGIFYFSELTFDAYELKTLLSHLQHLFIFGLFHHMFILFCLIKCEFS